MAIAAPFTPPTLAPPIEPSDRVIAESVCAGQTYTAPLKWSDKADNESAFRVNRDGKPIASTKSNKERDTDKPPGSGPYTYGVKAFNSAGASKRVNVEEEGCLS